MKTGLIPLTEAKKNLGERVKCVAYGKERVVLEFRGRPQAVLISWEEFQRLQEPEGSQGETKTLDSLREMRESIASRKGAMPNLAETLDEIRKERLGELTGMH